MNWDAVTGQNELKLKLKESIDQNRVSHAQLFTGREGYGTLALALAYAQEILSRENGSAAQRVATLNHMDLHFGFPTYSVSNKALSRNFIEEFRHAVLQNPYMDFDDWSAALESENKQLILSVHEVEAWAEIFSLKSFEGGTKILIVWNADKLREDAANKFLKFLEEPPAKTVIIFIAESEHNFLPTILSRTQLVKVPHIDDTALAEYLRKNYSLAEERIAEILFQAQGDRNQARLLAESNGLSTEFEALFVQWVRDAFQVVKKPELLKNIIIWARHIASWNREKQKNFLDFCAEIFRLALLQNYGNPELVYRKVNVERFNWESFARYIHGANIENILEEISTADYHLQRNANAKIVWTDLGIKLSRYIHRKVAS